jgi:GNAT superfamily N-acetyltransferase
VTAAVVARSTALRSLGTALRKGRLERSFGVGGSARGGSSLRAPERGEFVGQEGRPVSGRSGCSVTPQNRGVIRLATFDDIGEMARIELDAGQMFLALEDNIPGMGIVGSHAAEPEELCEHVASATAWVAVDADAGVVGYALASVVDGEGHLHQVSVQRSASGRGIGKSLINEVIAWTIHSGYVAVTLTTFRDVPWNGPYYARLGFVPMLPEEMGPELRAVRAKEFEHGVDVAPRIAMRLVLTPEPAP